MLAVFFFLSAALFRLELSLPLHTPLILRLDAGPIPHFAGDDERDNDVLGFAFQRSCLTVFPGMPRFYVPNAASQVKASHCCSKDGTIPPRRDGHKVTGAGGAIGRNRV